MIVGETLTAFRDAVVIVAVAVPDVGAVAVRHNVESDVVIIYAIRFGFDTSEAPAATDVVIVRVIVLFGSHTGARATIAPIVA